MRREAAAPSSAVAGWRCNWSMQLSWPVINLAIVVRVALTYIACMLATYTAQASTCMHVQAPNNRLQAIASHDQHWRSAWMDKFNARA